MSSAKRGGVNHKQVRIRANGQDAEVDEGIAPLIEAIWKCGIRTDMSCQDGAHGFVWLNFPNAKESERFLDIVAEFDPDPNSLYGRITGRWDSTEQAWKYGINAEDMALNEDVDDDDDTVAEHHDGFPCFVCSVSIWLPPSDVPLILKRLHVFHRGGPSV